MKLLLGLLLALGVTTTALAVEPDEILDDPALEERARDITRNIRCMVCQNESIDESNADLARDLRLLVREQIETGRTDEEIYAFIAARYGEFALFMPRMNLVNLGLYLSAPILLVMSMLMAVRYIRRRSRPVRNEALGHDDMDEVRQMIGEHTSANQDNTKNP